MKIAIIGGGWVGCHLALNLRNEHQVTIFDKNNELFCETSYNNQNRLHYGYHYARNYKTRELCRNTFDLFISDYGFLTKKIDNNLYCVPSKESFIDYETYMVIFNDFKNNKSEITFNNISGCINTNERYIDFKKSKEYFNRELKDLFINKFIGNTDLKKLLSEYDFVINATNNKIKNIDCKDSFYELTVSFLYEKINPVEFGALTLVDGDLFSIYPYYDELYTITDVMYTPLKKFKTIKKLDKFCSSMDEELINKRRRLVEKRISNYYPEFSKNFKYHNYFTSVKSKVKNSSDGRYPIISIDNNLINCFTGKIQGIFIIENKIKEIINKNDKR